MAPARPVRHLALIWPCLITSPSPSPSRGSHHCSLSYCLRHNTLTPVFRPQLRVPPPLTATGDPIVRPPEKTFLQKYWLYIVIALGALSAFYLAPLSLS
jgi:hypothetical protein